MPRYVVQREFPDGLNVPIDDFGARPAWQSSRATWPTKSRGFTPT